jgi:hypothetical protein
MGRRTDRQVALATKDLREQTLGVRRQMKYDEHRRREVGRKRPHHRPQRLQTARGPADHHQPLRHLREPAQIESG